MKSLQAKIRLLKTQRDKKGYYKGKELTITAGYNMKPFDYKSKFPAPLEQSEFYEATDGAEVFSIMDVRKEFSKLIAQRQTGAADVVLGITRSIREPHTYTDCVEILEYFSKA